MNQTQRKQIANRMDSAKRQKGINAMALFMQNPANVKRLIPPALPYSGQEMMLGIAGAEGGAPLKVSREDLIKGLRSTKRYDYLSVLNVYFPFKNQAIIDEITAEHEVINKRQQDFLADKHFLIQREYQNRMDTISLNDNYAEALALADSFDAFVP